MPSRISGIRLPRAPTPVTSSFGLPIITSRCVVERLMPRAGDSVRVPPKPLNAGDLMSKSRAVIGFWLAHCFGSPELLQPQMAELLGMVSAGTLKPLVGGTYPLADARAAHEALRSRGSVGKLILTV